MTSGAPKPLPDRADSAPAYETAPSAKVETTQLSHAKASDAFNYAPKERQYRLRGATTARWMVVLGCRKPILARTSNGVLLRASE